MGRSILQEKRTTKRSFSVWCLLVGLWVQACAERADLQPCVLPQPLLSAGQDVSCSIGWFLLLGQIGAETLIPFQKAPALPCCRHGSHWWGEGAAGAKHLHSIGSGLAASDQNMRRGLHLHEVEKPPGPGWAPKCKTLRDHQFCRAIEHHYKFLAGCKVGVFGAGGETCKLCQASMWRRQMKFFSVEHNSTTPIGMFFTLA